MIYLMITARVPHTWSDNLATLNGIVSGKLVQANMSSGLQREFSAVRMLN